MAEKLWNEEYRVVREDADTATVVVPWRATVDGQELSGEVEVEVAKTLEGAYRAYGSEARLLYQANRMKCVDARNAAASEARAGGNKEEKLARLITRLKNMGVSPEDILNALS